MSRLISNHKQLTAAIPDDIIEGEEIEVSDFGVKWQKIVFFAYIAYGVKSRFSRRSWRYARRLANAHQQHMADLDKGIKSAEAGINRHLEQRDLEREKRMADWAMARLDKLTAIQIETIANDLGEADDLPSLDELEEHEKHIHHYATPPDEVAENGRNVGQSSGPCDNYREDVHITDSTGEPKGQCICGYHELDHGEAPIGIGRPKTYRPWRDASEVPAPLMVRPKDMFDGQWCYAVPSDTGIIVNWGAERRFVTWQSAFSLWTLHDGSPCGVEVTNE